MIADIEICNYSPADANYELSFKTLPIGASGIGGGCNVVGPPSFDDPFSPGTYYPPPKPVTVPGGQCKIEKVRLQKPVAFTDSSAVGKVGCYETRLLNLNTGHVKRMNGSVQATAGPCPVVMSPGGTVAPEVFVLVPGAPLPIVIELQDSLDLARPMTVTVQPYDSDMSGEVAPLSVNGGRPGEAYVDTVMLPGAKTDERARIFLLVESASREPFGFQDIVVSADLDLETCGLEPLISVGFRSPLLSEVDLDFDGLTNDYEAAAGLSPYEPNLEKDIVELYAQAMRDVVECLKIFLEDCMDLIEPSDFTLVEDAIYSVTAASSDLFGVNSYSIAVVAVKSAVESLAQTSDIPTMAPDGGGTGSGIGTFIKVQPHIATLTSATGAFADGLFQFAARDGQDIRNERELVEEGKELEQMGKYEKALMKYQKAIRSGVKNSFFI